MPKKHHPAVVILTQLTLKNMKKEDGSILHFSSSVVEILNSLPHKLRKKERDRLHEELDLCHMDLERLRVAKEGKPPGVALVNVLLEEPA